MAIEIELKAWADDPEQVKTRLSRFARFTGSFLKEDIYWRPCETSAPPPGKLPALAVRIRRESTTGPGGEQNRMVLVNFKTKEIREGIEVNREEEFQVSGGAVSAGGTGPLEKLLGLLGLKPGSRKRKCGSSWEYQGITAELLEVEGLGTFLELEILAGDDLPETVQSSRKRLFALLSRAGISEDRVETRYYTEMLRSILEGNSL